MKQIKIFDTTLRDGEQCPGASLNTEEKIRIAIALDSLGVDIIEAGFAAASPDDKKAIMQIAEAVSNTRVCSLARAVERDIKEAGEAIQKAKKSRIHTFIATSDLHLKYKLRMSKQEALKRACDMVSYAKTFTDDVEFSAEDASRSDRGFLKEIFEAVIEKGAKTLNVPDTVGYAFNDEFGDLIKYLKENVKNIDQCDISIHCHDDLGLSVSNALSAVLNGATQIECTINGIGERAGNTALEEVVMALKTRKDLFQAKTNIDTKKLLLTSKLVSNLTGFQVPPNKAIVGKNAFAHESGIHQDGILKKRETYEIMQAKDVGFANNELVLGKHSGRSALLDRYKTLGFEIQESEIMKIFERFKNLADQKKEIFDEDLEAILEDERGKIGQKYTLDLLQISTGNKMLPTATIRLLKDGKKEMISADSGTGPVDAICNAINKITGEKNILTEFSVKAVTAGIDAVAEVTIKIEKQGRTFTGYGADTDIIVASCKAYLNALNRSIRAK
ncbi:MAG: 2-isopropylmalate synthase [Candidatus Gracilibacteria bacterium]|jgi:2-isopropylmalate synthase|nr:2-isopropylmalate synthase [Candidatus Gracilibacteria bacterium]